MLSELNGSGPVLLALTGNDDRSLGKVNWKKIRKAARVGAWVVAPGAMATIVAARAAKAALKRKQAKNIEALKIERADRARKLAEARKRQADAESAAKRAQSSAAAPAPAPSYSPAAPSDSPMEEVNETADTPSEETEVIQETTEEGAEESVEVMGYARSNDDYFVGAPLKSTVSKIKSYAVRASNSGQLRVVSKVGTPNKKLMIAGGLILGAYLFRKQLSRVFK